MNRGREPTSTLCGRRFLLEAIKDSKRLDGREVYDYRSIEISLDTTPGHVEVKLGDTRVLACVSCHVIQPRLQRPTEGQLHFNVELSPMASPSFEIGRPSSVATEITRTLERCVKESRAVDTESLCIIAGEKVWEVRVDVHVLDYCGNIIDCATIATVTALKHFRRPDVTVIGEDATIHPVTERDPVPLSVHHMPLCFTFAFFHGGERLLVDPSLAEEGVMDGQLVIGMNVHREICALQMVGGVAIGQEQVIRCTEIAAVKCLEVTEIIKKALSKSHFKTDEVSSILHTKQPVTEVPLPESVGGEGVEDVMEVDSVNTMHKPEVVSLDDATVELGMGGPNTWNVTSAANQSWSSSEEDKPKPPPQPKLAKNNSKNKNRKSKKLSEIVGNDSNSEEEDTLTLTSADLGSHETESELFVVEDETTSAPAGDDAMATDDTPSKNSRRKGKRPGKNPVPTASAGGGKRTPGQRTSRKKTKK